MTDSTPEELGMAIIELHKVIADFNANLPRYSTKENLAQRFIQENILESISSYIRLWLIQPGNDMGSNLSLINHLAKEKYYFLKRISEVSKLE